MLRPSAAQRVVAVDWSGAASEVVQRETIWTASVEHGRLVDLACGASRAEVTADLVDLAAADTRQLVVGMDFAFGLPEAAWRAAADPATATALGGPWADARAVWAAARTHGEAWLAECPAPFWGLAGTRRPDPQAAGALLRETDVEGAFSPLQIAGSGAVGTGTVRGMPLLADLHAQGFWVWPFARPAGWRPGDPVVVEVHPRVFAGRTVKSRWTARHTDLLVRYREDPTHPDDPPRQPLHLLERAAGSPDAYDAAISALELARHAVDLALLEPAAPGSAAAREGCIWRPPADPAPLVPDAPGALAPV